MHQAETRLDGFGIQFTSSEVTCYATHKVESAAVREAPQEAVYSLARVYGRSGVVTNRGGKLRWERHIYGP